MDIPAPIVSTVALAEQMLVRKPLQLLDERVIVPRLGTRSAAHRYLSIGVSALDSLVGRPSHVDAPVSPKVTTTSAAPTEAAPADATPADATPADATPADATPADATPADATPAQVNTHAPDAADAADVEPLPEEEQHEVEELTERLLAAEETQTFAGELAEDDEIRRAQAEVRAKQIIEDEASRNAT